METKRLAFKKGRGNAIVSFIDDAVVILDSNIRNVELGKPYDCILRPMRSGRGFIALNVAPATDYVEIVEHENAITINVNGESRPEFDFVIGHNSSVDLLDAIANSLVIFKSDDVAKVQRAIKRIEKTMLRKLKRACRG